MTKNTNKATRAAVDSMLDQFDLDLCNYNYRDALERLSALRRARASKTECIEFLTANDGCITKAERDRRAKLNGSQTLNHILENI